MKYATIITIAFVLAIFAQTAITTETFENTGGAESATTTLQFAIGQPAAGAGSKETITGICSCPPGRIGYALDRNGR